MGKYYRTTVVLDIITLGKPKLHPTNMIQSPGPIPSLLEYEESDIIDPFVEHAKITSSKALTKKEHYDYELHHIEGVDD